MSTPLYKSLKNGTSFYCFPSAGEKISAAQMNQNNKMYFSKYVLLNFPAQNLSVGTNSNPIYFDFLNSADQGYGFYQSINATPPTDFKDEIIESLRNYVANCEETIRTSRLNNTEYFYDNNTITTPAEKIFFKWAKQLNLIDFEPANNGDQYNGNLIEFERKNTNDDTYFPEILWTERSINKYDIYDMSEYSLGGTFNGRLLITFQTTTNFKIGDIVEINDETYSSGIPFNGLRGKVLNTIPATALLGQKIVVDIDGNSLSSSPNSYTGNVKIVYNRLIQFIGEINGVNNVQEANQSYTEIYAQVSGYSGATPDILFRTSIDKNYGPNLVFPILPSQYQPEIIGAEVYSSPIVSNPENYPGSYYGQFDTNDYTYTTSSGDSLRRSGDYYGISGDINTPIINSDDLDGISIDFNPSHYSKMNIYGREVSNFDQFGSLMVNDLPPSDYDFNSILWYYVYEDIHGNLTEDLYGISFIDNPDNNVIEAEKGLRFPTMKKLVATETQNGTAYDFSLDLNISIINENPQDLYNPNAINSLYSFNLYNKAMSLLASTNESFKNILAENSAIKTSLSDIKQLIYTQTDIKTINNKIANLENLLKLYQSNQLVSSDTIEVVTTLVGSVPLIEMNSIDPLYNNITNILTSNMYNSSGSIPTNISIPTNKNFLVKITNNDQTTFTLPNNNVLSVVLNTDLYYKQSMDLIIEGNLIGSENKKLDVYINYSVDNSSQVLTKIISNLNLPIFYNKYTKKANSAANLDNFNFNINMDNPIRLNVGSILEIPINSNYHLVYNSIKIGDTLTLNNFSIGTSSTIDFSGQYKINSIGLTNSYIYLDVNENTNLTSYGASSSLPLIFNDTSNYLLNKGYKYKITRVEQTNSSSIEDRYLVEKFIL